MDFLLFLYVAKVSAAQPGDEANVVLLLRRCALRIAFLGLLIASGCADTSADEPKVPDFHDYINLSQFCTDAGAGYYTLGYRSPMPWVDQVLCLSPEGISEVNATENGVMVEVKLVSGTGSTQGIMWVNNPQRDSPISLADGLIDSCPDKQKPLAILASNVDTYPNGATIKHGARLCMMAGDLVFYFENPGGDPEMHRWTNFTPVP